MAHANEDKLKVRAMAICSDFHLQINDVLSEIYGMGKYRCE